MPDLPQFSSRLGAPSAVMKPRRAKKPSQVTGNDDARLAAIRAEHEAEHQRRDTIAAQHASTEKPTDPPADARATHAAAQRAAQTAQRNNAPGVQTTYYHQEGSEAHFTKQSSEL